ncbi:glucose 1-dehydrogenase [Albidovulum sp.]|uniref:glucose 1-dehydrogenase n=1 Tax=Albidovulum sp. TaxID=1872424 RepID=UPI0039B8A359
MQDSGIPRQVQARQPGRETEMTPAPDYGPRFAASGRLKGKTALITGGDSGIGRATAVLFAREGANIAFHYKEEHEDAAVTIEAIRQEGAEVMAMHGDIGDVHEVKRLVGEAVAAFGHIGVLVNNAGEQHAQDQVEDISEEQLHRTFATNFFAQFHLVQELVADMRAGDAIVNVSSVTAFRGHAELVDYASSKGAILAFTRALSAQLAERGIRVNAVAPGPIWTPLIPASFDAEKVAKFGRHTPLGRPGQPNEVASAILFLACDDSSYVTGQTIHPNGGELVGG